MKPTAVLESAVQWLQTRRYCEDKLATSPDTPSSSETSSVSSSESDEGSDNEAPMVPWLEEPTRASTATHPPSTIPLDVIIVGAGIGGLATAYLLAKAGHHVTILESAPELSEVGAGLQLSPNATRLLARWGLAEKLESTAVRPQIISLRRYNDGTVLGWKPWGTSMEIEHGSPYYQVHRADLHRMLLHLLDPFDVAIQLNAKVTDIEPSSPRVTLSSGESVPCDLIIGADGLRSTVRNMLVGHDDQPEPTGDTAYRTIIPAELLLADPDLRDLIENPRLDIWMGPGRHIVGYCIRKQAMYNLVMVHPARDKYAATKDADLSVMKEDYHMFEPMVQKLLKLVPSATLWPLMDRQPMESWVHPSGKVCLLGDACHPTLPYRAQGAALALEDAAVLGNLLSRIRHKSQLPMLLKAYEDLRLSRASATQIASRANQAIFHFADGPDQERRDASMRKGTEAAMREQERERGVACWKGEDDCVGCQNMWGDRRRNREAFDYDADAEVEKWFEAHCLFGERGFSPLN